MKNFCYHNIDSQNFLYKWSINATTILNQNRTIKPFDLHKFNHLIGSGNIMMVGDSLTHQFVETLENMALLSRYGTTAFQHRQRCTCKCSNCFCSSEISNYEFELSINPLVDKNESNFKHGHD